MKDDGPRWTLCLSRRHGDMLWEALGALYSIDGARPAEEIARLDNLALKLRDAKSRVSLTTSEIGLLVTCLKRILATGGGGSTGIGPLSTEMHDFYRTCLKRLPDTTGDLIGAIGKLDGSRLIVFPGPPASDASRLASLFSTASAADQESGQTRRPGKSKRKGVVPDLPLKFLGPTGPITGRRQNR